MSEPQSQISNTNALKCGIGEAAELEARRVIKIDMRASPGGLRVEGDVLLELLVRPYEQLMRKLMLLRKCKGRK